MLVENWASLHYYATDFKGSTGMSRTGRPSSVETHALRGRIEEALDAGETYESIRTWTGLSVSSLSRFAISRKSDLAKLVDGEPSTTDVILRSIEIADDARDLRRRTKRLNATPVARARAIKVEAEALTVVIDRLGIDDTAAEKTFEQTQALLQALADHAMTDPDSTRSLLRTMRAHPALSQLAEALQRRLRKTR
ncbi:MAG TPA: hypothetical protein VIP82_19105 [Microbacterium sp.]|uniref:hypothetical protein n=1 Tax=Microbacterium sp. TaxID=51671 RepID=UPI002F94EA42